MSEDHTTDTEDQTAITMGLFSVDAPIAVRRFYGVLCSPSTFKLWRLKGVIGHDGHLHKLKTIEVEGIGVSVRPSTLVNYLSTIAKES